MENSDNCGKILILSLNNAWKMIHFIENAKRFISEKQFPSTIQLICSNYFLKIIVNLMNSSEGTSILFSIGL